MSEIITSTNRRPFEWLELDMPRCSRTYGVSPCQAALGTTGDQKCFNTRATCQDPSNYSGTETTTYNFCRNQSNIPDDKYYIPYLQNITVSPAKINPGGGNANASALGTRATLSASFDDHPHPDTLVDPYLSDRNYDPYEKSTFWAKWRSRNPYYTHRVVRYRSGYLGDDGMPDTATLQTRTFFVTRFSGFTSGNSITIQAKDVLTLAADEKAKAPAANTGKLSADLNETATTATLTPTGVGNTEYPTSGKVRINKEVMSFSRSGDVLTLTRAQNNTSAAEHDANDSVQVCLEYSSKAPNFILNDLLTTYAGIPATYLDTAQWATETTDYLPRLYSAIITEPTGVNKLISEMSEQMYFTLYWQEREAKLKLRAVRPAQNETITTLNDESNLLQGSINWRDKADELITDVWVYYAQKDPTENLDQRANYGALDIISDTDSKGADKNNTERIKVIFSRWITGANGAAATDLGNRILARYNNIPRECSFSVDAKDGALWLADFISLTNRNNVDFIGDPEAVPMQVISAQESQQGTTFSYTAIEYTGDRIEPEPGEFNIAISTDQLNLNLRDVFDAQIGTTPVSGNKVRFRIRSNVDIGGQSVSSPFYISQFDFLAGGSVVNRPFSVPYLQRRGITSNRTFTNGQSYVDLRGSLSATLGLVVQSDVREVPLSTALSTGTWPNGVQLFLDIEPGARVLGEGGNGSLHRLPLFQMIYGGDGGYALDITHPITINNLGIIAGGGGAGASNNGFPTISCGGGGAGFDESNIVTFLTLSDSVTIPTITSTASPGDKVNFGYGGVHVFPNGATYTAGNGGALANNGQPSVNALTPAVFGLAGDAVKTGANMITWVTKGDVRGTENN